MGGSLCSIKSGTTAFFAPVEMISRKCLLHVLIYINSCEINGEYWELPWQSMKPGGLVISNVVEKIPIMHEASKQTT